MFISQVDFSREVNLEEVILEEVNLEDVISRDVNLSFFHPHFMRISPQNRVINR